MRTPTEVSAQLRVDPAGTVLCLDFDGALAPIVDDPAAAVVLPGVGPVLETLVGRYLRTVVISGRPLAFLETHLPPGVDLVGLYGLERRIAGHRSDHPQAGTWREVVADVAAAAAHGPAGMRVELKGLSLTLHYRGAPGLADAVRGWADGQALRSGLRARPAKMSVELHPPIPTDKGTVVLELAAGARTVVYAGDDLGDLPAFVALDELAGRGLTTLRVVVDSPELPDELAARADVLLAGPPALLDLLRGLI